MKVSTLDVLKTIGGDLVAADRALTKFAADKVGQVWGAGKKRAEKTAQRANMIYQVTQNTCDLPLMQLVTTAIPAAGKAIWMVLVPKPTEIIEEMIQPKGHRTDRRMRRAAARSRRRGKNGKPRKRFRGIIPNTNTLVAGTFVAQDAKVSRVPGNIEGKAWFAWDRLERQLYHWLILEAWDKFIYEWSSGIMEARFCEHPQDAVFSGNGGGNPGGSTRLWTNDNQITVDVQKNVTVHSKGEVSLETPGQAESVAAQFDEFGGLVTATGGEESAEIRGLIQASDVDGNMINIGEVKQEIQLSDDSAGKEHQYSIAVAASASFGHLIRFNIVITTQPGGFRADRRSTTFTANLMSTFP